MTCTSTSHFHLKDDTLVTSQVPVEAFLPNSANMASKFHDKISASAWELWEFEAFYNKTAIGISFYRDGLIEDGFNVEVNAIWPDGTKWGKKCFFEESVISCQKAEEEEGWGNAAVAGVWKTESEEKSVSFMIDANVSTATVSFFIPGLVTGTMELRRLEGQPKDYLPKTEDDATLRPSVFYIFPMGPVATCADLTFCMEEGDKQRTLSITNGRGGMVRGWSENAWPDFITDAYYVVAHVGPYMLQLVRIVSPATEGYEHSILARLYKGGDDIAGGRKAVIVEKVRDGDTGGGSIHGTFRDQNTGYAISFLEVEREPNQKQRRWHFQVKHVMAWWSTPTSAPGVDGTGKSGWIEAISGGEVGIDHEVYEGFGVGGQLQLPGAE